MKVAAIQFEPGPDVAENVDRMVPRIEEAAGNGADLVVLPEIWNVGYFAFDAYADGAEPIDGPTVTRLSELAADHGVYLHTGSIVERDSGDLYNTSGLVSPTGELLDTYRKVHLFGYDSEEQSLLTPGERVVSVETEVGTVGLSTCYDLRFPALYRAMVDQGVELFLVTSAWPADREDHWDLLTRTRAVEGQAFLVAANGAGTNAGVDLAGASRVVGPWGDVFEGAGGGEETIMADVDLAEVDRIRSDFPALADRRFSAEYSLGDE